MINKTENKKKKSKLVFSGKTTRALLKKNPGDPKYCPYCGTAFTEGCECHCNIIIDCKPLRGGNGDESVMVFMNNDSFQRDLAEIIEEENSKKVAVESFEQLSIDFN